VSATHVFDGTPEFREVKREGPPDDNAWY